MRTRQLGSIKIGHPRQLGPIKMGRSENGGGLGICREHDFLTLVMIYINTLLIYINLKYQGVTSVDIHLPFGQHQKPWS